MYGWILPEAFAKAEMGMGACLPLASQHWPRAPCPSGTFCKDLPLDLGDGAGHPLGL